jgi:hypothetical protein
MNHAVPRVSAFVLALIVTNAGFALPSVLTQDYDNTRSGANLSESILTPASVSSATFGKLFSYPVDEEVHAQPLYVPNLAIAGGTHNVVYVATMGNSVYAFDADNAATANTPLWSVNLGQSVPQSQYLFIAGGGNSKNGIYSTPVIDPTSNTIYVLTHTWSTANQLITLQLHALDLATGAEKFGGPATLSAPGLDPVLNLQRAGLLLLNGNIYVALGSHSDLRLNFTTLRQGNYYGMILAYDAQTLAQVAIFNAETGGIGGSIWQGGRGLASDGTYIYTMTANAEKLGTADYSESFVQLNPLNLSVASYFQDPNLSCLNTLDEDLASAGPQIMPGTGTNLLLGGGKQGKIYTLLLDQALHTQTPSYFWGTSNYVPFPAEGGTCTDTRISGYGQLHGSDTAFWSNPSGASYFYSFGNNDKLMSWQLSGNNFTQTSIDTPLNLAINALAVSANGGSNGILWTVSNETSGTQLVSAYNAVPAAGHLPLLWNSSQVIRRDALGQQGRYAVPTIANGKVYVGSGSNQVVVFGLLPATAAVDVTPQVGSIAFTALNANSDVVFVNALGGYKGSVTLALTGLPPGFTYSFTPASVTLNAKTTSIASTLSISPAAATLPLSDDYTVLVRATPVGAATTYTPVRLNTRTAKITAAAKVACNSANQMSATVSWQMNGSESQGIWIQDATTPVFPGRLYATSTGSTGTVTTGYTINNKLTNLLWIIDNSTGIPANFDNALAYRNLEALYKCP